MKLLTDKLMLIEEINHRMPIYKNCSLVEVMILGLIVLSLSLLTFPLATKLLVNSFASGLVTALLGSFGLTSLAISQLSQLKAGKPAGFVSQQFRLWLDDWHLMRSPFIRRVGTWTTGRPV